MSARRRPGARCLHTWLGHVCGRTDPGPHLHICICNERHLEPHEYRRHRPGVPRCWCGYGPDHAIHDVRPVAA